MDDDAKLAEIRKALSTLTPREAMVLRELFGVELSNDPTLEAIAREFHATRQRLYEIEARVRRKLASKGADPDDVA